MSLVEAVQNRTPLVWVDTQEPERVIGQLPALCSDRELYIFGFDGLMRWSNNDHEWKIVLTEVWNDDEQKMVDVPIKHSTLAWQYVFERENATYILRNIHKTVGERLDMFSMLFGKYRNTFWQDDITKLPLQLICLATDENPPAELASMTTQVQYGLPSKSELVGIITHIIEHSPTDVLGDGDISALASAAAGMTEFETIETILNVIRKTGRIDGDVLSEIKFDRMRQNSSLDIIEPTVGLDEVGGLDGAKKLIERARWIYDHPDQAEEFKITPIRRILLVGVSGCGKSLVCEAAAKTMGLKLAKTGVATAMSKYVGESERNIRSIFRQINALAPIAVWSDEFGRDLSGGGSSDYVDAGTTSRVHATYLTEMQNLSKDVFFFAAANALTALAPEMLRADRFDKILFVGFPSMDERREIFRLNLLNPDEHDLNLLAARTPCWTGAEIKTLVSRVRNEVSASQQRHISTQDILDVVPRERNRIWLRHRHETIAMYRQAYDEFEWASSTQFHEASVIKEGREPLASSTGFVATAKTTLK